MSAIHEIQDDESRLEMTPMIDVTFLLLIFFICTIRFKSLEGKLAAFLPRDVGANLPLAEVTDPIRLNISVVNPGQKIQVASPHTLWSSPLDGPFLLEGHVVEYELGRDGYPGTEAGRKALAGRLAELLESDPSRRVTIDAMIGTLQADAVQVLDICLEVGLQDITFAGSNK